MYAEGECKKIVERGKKTKGKKLWKATYCLTTAIVNHMNGVAAATPRGPSTGSLIPAQPPQDKRPRSMCPVNVTSSDMMPTQVGKTPAPASGLDNGRRLSSERARMVPWGPQRPEAAAQRSGATRSNQTLAAMPSQTQRRGQRVSWPTCPVATHSGHGHGP